LAARALGSSRRGYFANRGWRIVYDARTDPAESRGAIRALVSPIPRRFARATAGRVGLAAKSAVVKPRLSVAGARNRTRRGIGTSAHVVYLFTRRARRFNAHLAAMSIGGTGPPPFPIFLPNGPPSPGSPLAAALAARSGNRTGPFPRYSSILSFSVTFLIIARRNSLYAA
jgi:hypothetical protein